MNRRLAVVPIMFALLAVAAASFAAPAAETPLVPRIESGAWWHEISDPVNVTFTLTNPTSTSIWLPRWQTPIDGIVADIFSVQRDGQAVAYTGMLAKRPAPEGADYVEIGPGETLSATFDISSAYDMTGRGQYAIRYQAVLQDALAGRPENGADPAARAVRALAPTELRSNDVTLWIEGRDENQPPIEPRLEIQAKGGKKPGGGGGSGQFVNCSNTQQTTVLAALANATTIADGALSYLNGGSDSQSLYKTWFDFYGTVNSGWNTAKSHFSAISDAFHTKPMSFDCSCRQRYYAYVYPTQPYTIYLCRVFWTAPALGTDSQAGTLVHETSHFNVVSGTNDWVYGTTGAQDLAKTDPTKALDNADNHEYFAEHKK